MPPVASSFSRTYLPKTCGYIRAVGAWARDVPSSHLSKAAAAAFALLGLATCHPTAKPQPVTVFVPASCGPGAPTATDSVSYLGTGDFSPPEEENLALNLVGQALTALGAGTRSIEIDAVTASPNPWTGVSLVGAGAPEVLLLPTNTGCALTSSHRTSGASVGTIDSGHALLVAGHGKPVFLVDLTNGGLTQVPNPPGVISQRSLAVVAPLAGGALVAGGTATAGPGPTTAVVYTLASNSFGNQVTFSRPHIQAGAAPLASGAVLVVGGEGTPDPQSPTSLEVVTPTSQDATLVGAKLQEGRRSPTVFELPATPPLTAGNIFVGGGVDPTSGAPRSTIEWFTGGSASQIGPLATKDLCSAQSSACCPLTAPVAFAPLVGGAVLAILAPKAQPPKASPCSNVVVIRPDFSLELGAEVLGASHPVLFAGAQGAPVLFTDMGALRWSPWQGTFEAPEQPFVTAGGAPVATTSPDPGLALWLGSDDKVWALRFDTRNVFSTDSPGTMLLDEGNGSEFAPDRLPSNDAKVDSVNGLTLQNGAKAYYTDATFADVEIDFTVTGPMHLVLANPQNGDAVDVFGLDGSGCLGTYPPDTTFTVTRQGASVTAALGGSQTGQTCAGNLTADERVTLSFAGPSAATASVVNVSVKRLGSSQPDGGPAADAAAE